MNRYVPALLLVFLFAGCASMGSGTKAEKQGKIISMRNDVLKHVYAKHPDARSIIESSVGYGVFSNANINLFLIAGGTGFGVVKNNQTGKNTYMNMAEAGVGLGLGVKDYRIVLVFHTRQSLNQFVKHGWNVAGNADLAGKASDKGGSLQAAFYSGGITIYTFTESGLAVQAVLSGTKFWKDSALN